jgi:hypothetical protein
MLGLEFEPIPVDEFGRVHVPPLESRLKTGDIGTVALWATQQLLPMTPGVDFAAR